MRFVLLLFFYVFGFLHKSSRLVLCEKRQCVCEGFGMIWFYVWDFEVVDFVLVISTDIYNYVKLVEFNRIEYSSIDTFI